MAGCDANQSANIPPIRAMLDWQTESHFMRMLTQKTLNNDLVLDDADGIVNKDNIPSLVNWTEQARDDWWVLDDEVELSGPVDLEFVP
jgi:hypothetical protein